MIERRLAHRQVAIRTLYGYCWVSQADVSLRNLEVRGRDSTHSGPDSAPAYECAVQLAKRSLSELRSEEAEFGNKTTGLLSYQ